jgi:hypothetical protein
MTWKLNFSRKNVEDDNSHYSDAAVVGELNMLLAAGTDTICIRQMTAP